MARQVSHVAKELGPNAYELSTPEGKSPLLRRSGREGAVVSTLNSGKNWHSLGLMMT